MSEATSATHTPRIVRRPACCANCTPRTPKTDRLPTTTTQELGQEHEQVRVLGSGQGQEAGETQEPLRQMVPVSLSLLRELTLLLWRSCQMNGTSPNEPARSAEGVSCCTVGN